MGTVIQFPGQQPDPELQPEPSPPKLKQEWMQQTLDGQLVRHPAPTGVRLGPHEREVLRALGFGSLTSTQAGKICHAMRGHCGYRCPYGEWNKRRYYAPSTGGVYTMGEKDDEENLRYKGDGCCPYAVSEGTEVMKRLKRRGFVEKRAGLWFAAPAWGQTWKEAQ